MSALGEHRAWLRGAVALFVLLDLFLVGYALAPSAGPDAPRTLRAGDVRLEYAPGWQRTVEPPGLAHPDGSRLRVRATERATAPGDRVVGLVDADGGTGVVMQTGAARTWVFATEGGGVRIECRNGGAADRCASVLTSVEVSDALPPSPDPATARTLRAAMRAIAASPAPRLAAAYERLAATARDASRAEGDGLARVASAARGVTVDLRAVTRAKAGEDRRAHAAARRRLAADHRRLRQALGALRDRGYIVEKGVSS